MSQIEILEEKQGESLFAPYPPLCQPTRSARSDFSYLSRPFALSPCRRRTMLEARTIKTSPAAGLSFSLYVARYPPSGVSVSGLLIYVYSYAAVGQLARRLAAFPFLVRVCCCRSPCLAARLARSYFSVCHFFMTLFLLSVMFF